MLSRAEAYPAGVAGITTRVLTLRSGIHVRIAECGPPGGASVVLLSGWGACLYLYRRNLPALASAGYRAVAVDMVGQGFSDKPSDPATYTVPSLAGHVLEVLDALGLPRTALVGQSLGGRIALEVALTAPDRVTRLILISPAGLTDIALTRAKALLPEPLAPLLARHGGRWTYVLGLRFAAGSLAQPTEHDIDEYAAAADPALARALIYTLHRVDWRPLSRARLAQLSKPLLVITGSRDRIIPSGDVPRRLRDVPQAHHVQIEGGGHMPNEEAPELVNRELVNFLGSTDAPGA